MFGCSACEHVAGFWEYMMRFFAFVIAVSWLVSAFSLDSVSLLPLNMDEVVHIRICLVVRLFAYWSISSPSAIITS